MGQLERSQPALSSPPASSPSGLEAAFLAHREELLRFLRARGAGDAAEDLLHDVWLKVAGPQARSGPVAAPLGYLYRTANTVMIDRYRSLRQAGQRDRDWVESAATGDPAVSETPSAERVLIGREQLALVTRRLEALGPRVAGVLRRHRIDGVPQRLVAEEFGISLSTVESDLRAAYRAIAEARELGDEV
jgi:RNA polymerase sigma-70 factor (ECF subfamily)